MTTLEEVAKRSFRVGRNQTPGEPSFAFNIRRKDDGGISLFGIDAPLAESERQMLFAHFGSPIETRDGDIEDGVAWTTEVTRTPGDAEHFVAAVHQLPAPFILLPRKG